MGWKINWDKCLLWSNINDVLSLINVFRDLVVLFLNKNVRVHSWEIFGHKDLHPFPPSLPTCLGKEKCIFVLDQACTYQDVALCVNNGKILLSEASFVYSSAIYGFVVCKGAHTQKLLKEEYVEYSINVCKSTSDKLYAHVKRGHRERFCNGIG